MSASRKPGRPVDAVPANDAAAQVQQIVRQWLRSVLERHALKPTELAARIKTPSTTLTRFLNDPKVAHTLSTPTIFQICWELGESGPWPSDQDVPFSPPFVAWSDLRDHLRSQTVAAPSDGGAYTAIERGVYRPERDIDQGLWISWRDCIFTIPAVDHLDRIIPTGAIAIVRQQVSELEVGRLYVLDDGSELFALRMSADPLRFESVRQSMDSIVFTRLSDFEALGQIVGHRQEH
jgi:hypothetical protein